MSQPALKYNPEDFDKTWNSIKPDGDISPRTLFHYAMEAGWINQAIATQLATPPDAKDIRNARLFAEANRGRLLFIPETGDILKFDSSVGWTRAGSGEAERAAKEVIAQMRTEAAELFKQAHDNPQAKELNKHADYSSTAERIQAMIDLAKSELRMSESVTRFDADPNLLGVRNGILNLKAKKLLPVAADVLVSKRANAAYDSSAKCPMWMRFLSDIQPDKAIQRLLQQLAGIFLCGDSTLQKLIFFYGQGANGKSTFIELIAWLLGDYSKRIATEMLMRHQRNPQGPSPDIVGLKGRRLVYCNEVEEGRHLAEARVKELTGGDTLSGRVPYAKEDITFQPSHKLVMVGNHQPEIHDMSHGMWRRMLLIPFDQTIPKAQQDPNLLEKLKAEGPGILNWALAGYQDYLEHGLHIPPTVEGATLAYREEQDIIGEWLKEHCKEVAGATTNKGELYRVYSYWAKQRGQHPLAQRRLTRRLSDRGFKLDAGKRNITGLTLNADGQFAARKWL